MKIKIDGILVLACVAPLALSGCTSAVTGTEAERAFTAFDAIATNGKTKNKIDGDATIADLDGANDDNIPIAAYVTVDKDNKFASVEINDGSNSITWSGTDYDTSIVQNARHDVAIATKGIGGPVLLMGNPVDAGFNYQTFGAWHNPGTGLAALGGFSVGSKIGGDDFDALEDAATTAETLTFTGASAGVHSNGTKVTHLTAEAELVVTLLAAGSTATFKTTNTTDGVTPADWAAYNLSTVGTLAVSGGVITGNVATSHLQTGGGSPVDNDMTGNLAGNLYGADGTEAGGTFSLTGRGSTDGETYIGGFGAKK